MRLNNEIRKKYFNICYKQKLNCLFEKEELAEQFYAQKRLIESMFKTQQEELESICDEARGQAFDDFNFFTCLG